MRFPLILGLVLVLAPLTIAQEKPNVLLIVADDLGYAELGCQGGDIPTPHIDSIAANGIRFTAGYVTAPYCSPSRAGLLTGRYQQRFGHELNVVEFMNDLPHIGLPPNEKTLADYLRQAGYVTGLSGKWHLGAHPPYHPQRRGFQEFFGFLREGHYYLPEPFDDAPDHVVSHLRAREPLYNRENPILRGTEPVDEKQYLTEALAREAESFIQQHRDRPWLLYYSFNAPHSPMQATPRDYARFASISDHHRRVWAAMVASMDDAVGRVLNQLRALQLERRTLVIFLSDNGGPTQELTSRNDPFSGGKGSLREGGVRVPFLISWPGTLPSGVVDDRPISALDIVPTAIAAAGESVEASSFDGVNLLPYLKGESRGAPHDTLYWRMGPAAALRHGPWKLARFRNQDEWQLFNLAEDVQEERDLAAEHPARVRELESLYARWNAQLVEPLWSRK